MAFLDLASDWYSASVAAIIYLISVSIWPHYDGTRLYCESRYHPITGLFKILKTYWERSSGHTQCFLRISCRCKRWSEYFIIIFCMIQESVYLHLVHSMFWWSKWFAFLLHLIIVIELEISVFQNIVKCSLALFRRKLYHNIFYVSLVSFERLCFPLIMWSPWCVSVAGYVMGR